MNPAYIDKWPWNELYEEESDEEGNTVLKKRKVYQQSLNTQQSISVWKKFTVQAGSSYANNFASNATASVAASGGIGATINVFTISQVIRANTEARRIGRRVTWKAVRIGGAIANAAVSTVANVVSFVIVYDKAPNQSATLPSLSTIFEVATSADWSINNSFTDRFVVLKVLQYAFPIRSATIETDSVIYPIDELIDLRDFPGIWTDADVNGDYASMQTGAIYGCCKGTNTIVQGAPGFNTIVLANYYTDQ